MCLSQQKEPPFAGALLCLESGKSRLATLRAGAMDEVTVGAGDPHPLIC